MATDTTDYVQVTVRAGEGAPYVSENMWAEPIDITAGVYRVDNIAYMAQASKDDLVRCEVSSENRLVAVEVLERSPNATVLFALAASGLSGEARKARQRRLVDRIERRYGRKVRCSKMSSGPQLSVWVPEELLDQLFETVLADSGPDAVAYEEEDAHVLGDWAWLITAHPEWEVPDPIEGADELLDRDVELVAVDWPADDPVAADWPDNLKESLRDQAATNPQQRRMLEERRYVAALVPRLRIMFQREHGMDAVGPQPFPIYPSEDPSEQNRFMEAWTAVKRPDSRVRWCTDDTVDAEFRRTLEGLGLDPDVDPRQPVT